MTEKEPSGPIQSASTRVDLPATAAWRHLDARAGFEVLFLRHEGDRYHLDGYATAIEEGEPWAIRYALVLDSNWATRSAHIVGRSPLGDHEIRLENDGTRQLANRRQTDHPALRMHRRRSRGLRMHKRAPRQPPKAEDRSSDRRSCRLRARAGSTRGAARAEVRATTKRRQASALRLLGAVVRLQNRSRL
jgi:Putative glycolipid-binding